jgi:hypothetical protein
MDAAMPLPEETPAGGQVPRGCSIHIEDVRRGRHLVVESWIADGETAVALAVHLAKLAPPRMPRA